MVDASSEPAEVTATAELPKDVVLHARPAAMVVRTASAFSSSIKLSTQEGTADAKSLISVLSLGTRGGSEIRISATGEDSQQAAVALTTCISGLSD